MNTKKRARTVAFALTAILLSPVTAQEQAPASAGADLPDFESALFAEGAFDAPGESAEAASTEYLVGGTVVAQASATLGGSAEGMFASSGASGRIFAKVSIPDYGALYVAYNASHVFFRGYRGDGMPPPSGDPYTPDFSLAEFHYGFDVAKALFLRIGNQLIAWGPSQIWTPVDFINLEKSDAFAGIDSRTGKPGLRLHLPLRGSNAFLFADFSAMARNGIAGDPLETANLGGRFDFTLSPFEFGLSGYGGANSQARFGADAAGRLAGFTVYGEFAWAPGYSDYDAYMQASLGFSRSLDELKRWTLSAEGFYNSRGRDLTGYDAVTILALPAGERTPLYQGEFYAYAALSAKELFSPSLATTLQVLANFTDLSYSLKLSESFSFPRAVPITLAAAYAGGGDGKEFTRAGGSGSVSLTLSTRLEF